MEQDLMAFWKHNSPKLFLSGKIKKILSDGKV